MKLKSEEFVDFVFSQNGLLSRFLNDYELREEQRQMALQVLEAFEKEQVALIEAGTGVGKSWAYLVPAIFWALKNQEQTVISTNTIPLQEQLLSKDIPFLLSTLNVDLQAVLVKGMSNYLCLRKLQEVEADKLFLTEPENEKLIQIEQWAESTEEGSFSEIPFSIPSSLLEKVSAERSSCNHSQCPHYKKCFFFKARKQMADAQILVVNHHLLMAELSSKLTNKGKDEKSVLPKFHRLIVDEAHHLEEIALESFSRKIDRLDLVRWLGRLYSDHHPEKSRCVLLLKEISHFKVSKPSLQVLLETELPGEKRAAVTKIETLFRQIEFFCQNVLKEESSSENKELKWRLKPEHLLNDYWQEEIKPLFTEVVNHFTKLVTQISSIRSELDSLEKPIQEKLSAHIQELDFVSQRLSQKAEELQSFVSNESDIYRVRWVEMTGFNISNVMLIDANLNVAEYLKEHLFEPRLTSILCSATLTAQGNFDYIKERVGLSKEVFEETIKENIYQSPFDYQNRTLLAIPKDIPFPSDPRFTRSAAEMITKAIQASRGSCFVLFTSYEMLNQCYQMVSQELKNFPIFKQGDASRQVLIDRFKSEEGNVLFATDSFWEGVDVPGEALRCVILVKLPFRVPSDPLYQAFSEVYTKEGKDPFLGYSIPQASLKFKQGFGRLMRKKNDRGCVLCLDKRLMAKNYGALILKGIPDCKRVYEDSPRLFALMKEFYEKTSQKV